MTDKKHQVTTTDHRGNIVVLHKPANESAMTAAELQEWHKQRHEHIKSNPAPAPAKPHA